MNRIAKRKDRDWLQRKPNSITEDGYIKREAVSKVVILNLSEEI